VKNILLFHKNVLKLDIVEKLKDNKILDWISKIRNIYHAKIVNLYC
jgi:hypothetical protein